MHLLELKAQNLTAADTPSFEKIKPHRSVRFITRSRDESFLRLRIRRIIRNEMNTLIRKHRTNVSLKAVLRCEQFCQQMFTTLTAAGASEVNGDDAVEQQPPCIEVSE